MFSSDDAKAVFQMVSTEEGYRSPLILSSRGDGFVVRECARRALEAFVTEVYAQHRVLVNSLARNLDVDEDTIRSLAQSCENTFLLGGSTGREIISKAQKDTIDKDLESHIMNGVISREAFARNHNLSHSNLDHLIALSDLPIVDVNGYLYSTSYEKNASKTIADLLREHLQKLQVTILKSSDVAGNPPTWFIHRIVNKLLEDPEFAGNLRVHGRPRDIRCTPVQLLKQTQDNAISDLKSGKTAYIDLSGFQSDGEAIYSSTESAQAALENTDGIELVGTFAISKAWISNFSKDCLSGILRDGGVEVKLPLQRTFPNSILSSVVDKVEQEIRAVSPKTYRVGDSILSEYGYSQQRDTLVNLTKADALSQWQRHKADSKVEVKFSLSRITDQISNADQSLRELVKERTVERALNDTFDVEISELERQNEAEFALFWTDRVVTRVAIYTEGLTAVEDSKLLAQLSDLLAQYIQKELLPDAMSKALSQGVLLSRKTRKNIQKLESALNTGSMDVPALMASIDKFNKKQSIEAPTASSLETSKATMLGDMARRMQRQKKSDGPLLFLTLVVFLFAQHNVGVVYATGKFAPKLLKQLKAVLDAEKYAQLEAWKEAAKAGTLSAEDREGMKKMVDAGI